MSDRECRADRICHEGRCRFSDEVREELAARRQAQTSGDEEVVPEHPPEDLVESQETPVAVNSERAMFMGGMGHTGRSEARGPASMPRLRWVHRTGARVHAAPVIGADGTIYVGSTDRSFVAIAPDGSLRWRYAGGDRFYASAVIMHDGTIVTGNHDGTVAALTPEGLVRWQRALGAPIDASLTLDDEDNVYVAANGLWALDPRGNVRWRLPTADTIRTTPAIHPLGLVIVGTTDGRVMAARLNGELAWEARTGASVDGGASIADDGTIYVGNDLGQLLALDPRDGAIRWRYQAEGDIRATPAIARDGTIIVGSDDRSIHGIAADGTLRFRVRTSGRVRASARIDADGRIYVGSQDDFLYALAPDGTLVFRHNMGHDVDSTAVIASDGTLIVGTDDGGVYALEAASR
jgi:outer membrane protein assembly factor BamB